MSDHSETSSFNGEWEQMSDSDQDLVNKVEQMEAEMKNMKIEIEKMQIEINQKDEKMERNKEEMRTVRKEKVAQEEENAVLRAQVEKVLAFSMEEWMNIQMENLKMSSKKLNEKTMELYKKIWVKGVARTQATNSSERKQLTGEIQELEDLCEEIVKEVQTKNEECTEKITNVLQTEKGRTESKITGSKNKNLPIESFLGTYTTYESDAVPLVLTGKDRYASRTMVIRKAKKEGYYQISWIFENQKMLSIYWILDNIEREDGRVWIEGNTLFRVWGGNTSRYQLTDNGLFVCRKYSLIRV